MSLMQEKIFQTSSRQWGHYRVFGKTIKYNQLLGNIDRSTTLNGLTYTVDNTTHSIHITGTATGYTYFYFQSSVYINFYANHKYLGLSNKKGSYTNINAFNILEANDNINGFINTKTSDGRGRSYISFNSGAVVDLTIIPMIIDLTELFGAGNEPTTLEQFYATDLGKAIQGGWYPSYSATNTIYTATAPLTFKGDNPAMTSLAGKKNKITLYGTATTGNSLSLFSGKYGIGSLDYGSKTYSMKTNNKHALIVKLKEFTTNTIFHPYITCNTVGGSTIDNRYSSYYFRNNYVVFVFINRNETDADYSNIFLYSSNQAYFDVSTGCEWSLVDLTEYGLDNLTAQQFYDRYNHLFDKLANGETVFKPQTVSILQNGQPLQLGGYNEVEDYYLNASGKVNRVIGSVDLGTLNFTLYGTVATGEYLFYATISGGRTNVGEGNPVRLQCEKYKCNSVAQYGGETSQGEDKLITWDANNPQILIKDTSFTDATAFKNSLQGVLLYYELATPTTEQANSVMLPKGITKCFDTNGLELEIELLNDPSNFSNKIVQGKNSPTITVEKVITKGFTSGGEHFVQIYIYDDGEIWYVNGGSSAQAYASGVWEIEYKTLQFDSGVQLNTSERNALLSIYDLI